jgi:hypothetical protein
VHRRAVASSVVLCGIFCTGSLLFAVEPPKPTTADKRPVKANPAALTVVRVQGTVAWPSGGGNPTSTSAATACGAVKVTAVKETPSGGMVPKTETVGDTTASAVDPTDVKKGCSYALVGLPTAVPLKISARFTGAWSTTLGGGGVWSEARTVTLKPGTLTLDLPLKVNAVK